MTRPAGSREGRCACALAGGFSGGVAAGFLSGATSALPLLATATAVAAAAGVVALAGNPAGRTSARWSRTVALASSLAFTVVLGACRGASAVEVAGPHRVDGHLGARPVAVVGTVRATQPGGGVPVIVDVERIADAGEDVSAGGGLLVSGSNVPAVAPGDRVEVDAVGLRAPDLRPGPESAATLERAGVEAVAVAPLVSVTSHAGPSLAACVAWAQSRLIAGVDAILPEPQAALTLGVAFGIRQPLAGEVRQPLQDAGLIHIVVVSGLKVVILVSLIALVARGLAWSPRRSLPLAVPVVAGYVVLSGSGPAAVRSAVMAGAATVARQGGRRTDPLPMLALVAALMLGFDPPLVRDPGFQLSFLGTAGIVLLADPLARRLPGPRLLIEPFAVTVAAQLATVPVMAATFGVVALLGPLANALVLPLLPALIVVGGAGAVAACVVPAVGWPLLQLAALGDSITLAVARVAAAVPGAAIHVAGWPAPWVAAEVAGGLAAAACWWVVTRRRDGVASGAVAAPSPPSKPKTTRARAVAAACLAGVTTAGVSGVAASRPDGQLHVTVLSTGAAPAVLVQGAAGSLALIDGGASPLALTQALGRTLAPTDHRIELVVASGGEQPAVAGLAGLPGHYDVGAILASRSLNPGALKVVAALQAAGAVAIDPAGRPWTWGGAHWRCLTVRSQTTDRTTSALVVRGAGGALLVLGQLGTAEQDEIAAVDGPALAADVVVSEPGGALAAALLAAARPKVIVVPSAQGGHASAAPPGYTVLRTGAEGDLRFVGTARGLQLRA